MTILDFVLDLQKSLKFSQMKKRFVFIVRHCDYNRSSGDLYFLNGDESFLKSISEIQSKIISSSEGDRKIAVIYSPWKRCKQTADIIVRFIPSEKLEENKILNPFDIPRPTDDEIISFVVSRIEEILILVAHEELTDTLPYRLQKKYGRGEIKVFDTLFCGKYHFLELVF